VIEIDFAAVLVGAALQIALLGPRIPWRARLVSGLLTGVLACLVFRPFAFH
jgi:hypothetical protein